MSSKSPGGCDSGLGPLNPESIQFEGMLAWKFSARRAGLSEPRRNTSNRIFEFSRSGYKEDTCFRFVSTWYPLVAVFIVEVETERIQAPAGEASIPNQTAAYGRAGRSLPVPRFSQILKLPGLER